MSSPKAAPAKGGRGKAKADPAEPSKSEKAAFVKAMWEGIKPGSLAAEKSAAKKGPAQKAAASGKAKKPAGKKAPETKGQTDTAPKVEILRRIVAAPQQSGPDTAMSAEGLKLAKSIEAALAEGKFDELQPHALQALMAALCKAYAANDDADNRFPILSGRAAVTGTDVMIVCGALLKAVDLQVFELGMWQTWAGR